VDILDHKAYCFITAFLFTQWLDFYVFTVI